MSTWSYVQQVEGVEKCIEAGVRVNDPINHTGQGPRLDMFHVTSWISETKSAINHFTGGHVIFHWNFWWDYGEL